MSHSYIVENWTSEASNVSSLMDSHSPTPKTIAFDSSCLFDSALKSFSQQCLQPLLPPPHSLPPFPSNFPHSKLIPKSRFAVDAFRHAGDYSVSHFLSHFHSDHYGGLGPNWSSGIVYCSDITARLLVQVLKVSPLFVVALPLSTPIIIDRCEVTLIDANHCPGAVQFLFKMSNDNGKIEKYVHTGDFRFCDSMILDPILAQFVGSDAVFLDTTYCHPKFVFPSQEESISYIVNTVERIGVENEGAAKNVLFLVATYVIGKEKILLDIASRCNRKIHVDSRKMSVLRVLGHEEGGVFTEDESESDIHVIGWNVLGETWPYFRPNFVKMREVMSEKGYNKVVGFVPTGWTYEVKNNKFSVRSKESLEIHLVPYSEHSNYTELRKFVKYLRPKRVVPTVGLDVEKLDSKHANKMRKHFLDLVDDLANKQDFLSVFHRGNREMVDKVEKHVSSTLNEELEEQNVKILSGMKSTGEADPCFVIETPSVPCVDLQDSTVLNDDDVEKYVCELRECLPTWVTRNQMIDLINSSEGNVVEAVSNFYEREIEFSEECFANGACVSTSQTQTSTAKDPSSISKENDTKRRQCGIIGIPLTLTKGCISPGKRKKDVQRKINKAIKLNSSLHTSGSKQSTITSFFCKVASDVNNDEFGASTIKQSSKDQKLPFVTAKYAEKVDQFIQIINGGESSKTFAASVLEKTNGDINQALDLYYTNPDARITHNEENMSFDRKLVDAEGNNDKCFSSQEKVMPENSLAVASVSGKLIEKADTTLVSLPPEKYDPINHACWSSGQPAPYIHLARTFELLENEKGKIKATCMLCNMFRSLLALYPEDVLPAVYLCTNKISSDHENMELNVGGSLVVAALEETCGTSRSKVTEMYNKLGDLGDVAQACRKTQRCLLSPSPLLVKDLLFALREISVQTGSGSTARKKGLIANLMRSCRENEMKFLVRTLVRNMRIGAMLRTVLPALAQAVLMNSSLNCHVEGTMGNLKEKLQCLSSAVVDAYNVLPNLDLIVPSLMDKGIVFSSKTLSMIPGIPIKPMLSKITNGVSQALKLFENKAFTCEYKYDGQRAQIHKLDDGSVRVFSRNGDETTSRFPDLICIIKEACKPNAATFILDAEVVAVDRKYGGKLLSFQELSSRGRGGRDSLIRIDDIKVDICVFVFDIMFANGEQLLGMPLRQRRTYLKEMFCDERLGYFEYAKEVTVEKDDACSNSEATFSKISSFLENAFQSSCEGIMVKSLDVDAGYFPSKRSDSWLKVKRDYLDGVNDSLDLVPVGAWYGNGRKAGWFSPFLMACYNPETEEFQSVCRVMSGFSDAFYIEMKEFFHGSKILPRKPPYYCTGEMPDMWFSAEVVWEVRGADFTVSPVHHAAIGLVHPTRGISVRFPRFIRVLADRSPEECSTAADIAEMFNSQTRKMHVSTHD